MADAPAPRRGLTGFEWACLGVAAVALLVRAGHVLAPGVIWDSAWYLMLARSFAEDGTFWIRWTDPPQASSYWPPLFPVFASVFVKLLGPSYSTLALASTAASVLLAAATLATTWDLMGRTRAFAAMALVAASPAFLGSDARGMSESLVALTVLLALWALLKGVRRPAWLAPAAAFGALAYLAKANLGLPFFAAGLAALGAWRVRAKGLRAVLRSPVDVGAAAVAALGLAAALLLRGGDGALGGVGLGVIHPVREAVAHPLWVPFLLFKLAFAAAFLATVTLPFSLRLREAARAPRRDETDALWIAVGLILLATGVFTASFLITEERGPLQFEAVGDAFGRGLGDGLAELGYTLALLVDFDNVRYLSPAIVPFLWIVLPHVPFERDPADPPGAEGRRFRRRHETAFALAVGLLAVVLLLNPMAGLRRPGLGRLWALLLLSAVPLALALAARAQSYALVERTGPRGAVAWRYVAAKPPAAKAGAVALAALAALALGWLASSWWLVVAVGLAVASCSATARGAAVAMALALLCSVAPTLTTPYPAEEAAAWIDERLPPGAVLGATEPIVYFAAVAPDDVALRLVAADDPGEVDALLVVGGEGYGEYPDFTRVAAWDYPFEPSPTLRLRLAIERDVLGQDLEFQPQRALTLFVRNGTLPDASPVP